MTNDRKYIVVRVDESPVWFSGYESGQTTVTKNRDKAITLTLNEARNAVQDLKSERNGVWGIWNA